MICSHTWTCHRLLSYSPSIVCQEVKTWTQWHLESVWSLLSFAALLSAEDVHVTFPMCLVSCNCISLTKALVLDYNVDLQCGRLTDVFKIH